MSHYELRQHGRTATVKTGERHCVALFAIFAFSVLGMNTPLHAGEADKAQAKAHYATATRYYEVQEYDKALSEYKAAYVAKPDPAFLFNIGQCYRKLGSNEKAQEYFKQFLKKAEPNDPNRALVEARIRDTELDQEFQEDFRRESKTTALRPKASTKPAQENRGEQGDMQPTPLLTKASNSFDSPPQTENLLVQKSTLSEPSAVPVYKTWWFWTGIGGVVVGGVVTAVLLSSGSGTSIPTTSLGSQGAF